MTTPTRHNIMLPEERMVALRDLADQLGGVSMSATLKALFAAARAQGLIKDHTIPGVTVNSFKDGIAVRFDDGEYASLTLAAARQLAATIRQFVEGSITAPLADLDNDFSVRRKGRGIIVAINAMTEVESSKVWNSDIALEFADLLDAAVKKHDPK